MQFTAVYAWPLIETLEMLFKVKRASLSPDKHGPDGESENVVSVRDAKPPSVLVAVFPEHRLLQLLAGVAVV